MGVVTFTEETTSPVPAARMFKALIVDADSLLPQIVPQVIKNVETIQGDGGPGSIKQMNFTEASPFKYVKHRIDALDKENMVYKYALIEGDALLGKLDSISYEISFSSSGDGGCIAKNVSTYHTKAGAEIKEEEIKAGKEMTQGVFKAVETYLQANPDA